MNAQPRKPLKRVAICWLIHGTKSSPTKRLAAASMGTSTHKRGDLDLVIYVLDALRRQNDNHYTARSKEMRTAATKDKVRSFQ
jgi:hypothetical protein